MTATSDEHEQLRSKLWHTINERYPGSMIEKHDFVPLAPLAKPLSQARLTFVSTAGVQLRAVSSIFTFTPPPILSGQSATSMPARNSLALATQPTTSMPSGRFR